MIRSRLLYPLLLALAACGASGRGDDADADGDADTDADADADADADGDGDADVGVNCLVASGPNLVVVRPSAGDGPSRTLLRLPVWFSRAVGGVGIDAVTQLDGAGAVLREWDADALVPPDGFDGDAVPREGTTEAIVLFHALADSLEEEERACDAVIWERSGNLAVEGHTEDGPFTLQCGLGMGMAGRMPERSPFACARGIAGWVPTSGYGVVSEISDPIQAHVIDTAMGAHGTAAGHPVGWDAAPPIDDFLVTGATVTVHVAPVLDAACGEDASWEATGRHVLWRGSTSEDVWSGPVAPGSEESFRWFFQGEGLLPLPTCQVLGEGGDFDDPCLPPVARMTVRGSSSVGAWEWESDLFQCHD